MVNNKSSFRFGNKSWINYFTKAYFRKDRNFFENKFEDWKQLERFIGCLTDVNFMFDFKTIFTCKCTRLIVD